MAHPRELLRSHGLAASRRRGQSFLTQPATAAAIASGAGIQPTDTVVEIGAGLGALTLALAPLARRVIAVEVDRGVFAALQEVLAGAGVDNVEPRHADALRLDWTDLARQAGGPLVVVGNLPYALTSPLLFSLIAARDHWRRATLLLQREVAERLKAAPGGKTYGRLSVVVQTWCQVALGMVVGPKVFFPRPAVSSRVVHLTPRARPLVPLAGPEEAAWFTRVVKAAFSRRRKTLANSLAGGLGLERAEVARALRAAGLDPACRAETLSVPELGQVARALEPLRPLLEQGPTKP